MIDTRAPVDLSTQEEFFILQANYSFSGALHTLSKLIIIAVMLRGRHRGLPIALDRAILLPHEFQLRSQQTQQQQNPDNSVDSEKQESPDSDRKSFHTGDMHTGDDMPTMSSSLPAIYEEPIYRPSGSGSHVMWPTNEATRVAGV